MLTNSRNWLKVSVFAALLGFAPEMFAQAVIFPQEAQPGVAVAEQQGETFTIKNDLLTATFKNANGKLTFEGCEQLNMLRSDDIFYLQVGKNKVTVPSSAMTLGEVTVENLDADPDAATGSFRLPGKSIKATYAYKGNGADLTIVWQAVLRNDSHYLRTKMDITANKDSKMYTMVPLKCFVDNSKSQKVPAVVGNTRGAVIVNDKIFAGLESPMGLNTVEAEGTSMDMADFSPKSWNNNSFRWKSGEETPEAILNNGTVNKPNEKLGNDQVVGARGYVKFYEAGEQTITFQYGSGPHRLNIVGVDVLNDKGEVVSTDYHTGFTGGQKKNNVYKINVPTADCYQVRYFVEIKSESVESNGSISFNKKIAPVQVIFDGKANASMLTAQKASRALSANEIGENEEVTDSWKPADWTTHEGKLPQAIYDKGWAENNIQYMDREITINTVGELNVLFQYKKGNNRLDIAGVFLMSTDGKEIITADSHKGFTGTPSKDNLYKVKVPYTGTFKLRYYVGKDKNDSQGEIKISLPKVYEMHLPAPASSTIQCMWRRDVVLKAKETWNVSAVIGLVAKDQARRSVLSYVERERAVPWRAYPIYNSWYELNIDRNNDRNYTGNMHDYQCIDVVKQWQKNLYEPYGTGIECFVWDDGWDIYGTWQFNQNFPNGFAEQDRLARQMEAGTGAWLGPVGGYGQSGNYRRDYWANKGGMQLSNPEYYKVFYKGCTDLMKNNGYDFRYFKFDGISAQWSSVGPDGGIKGEENAEGIIYAELDMRKVQPDIFFNTSVGTWASPFWFRITDAVWRQENDYGEIGNNSNSRERWITYRDRLVYQNFVQNSPMCPINNLMTHGFILSDFGPVSKDRNYDAIVREMRCAFACGSAMVELYCDYKLMNSIKDNNGKAGALWGELAKCIEWQKKNEAVLPDIHWVGGNPWNGSGHEVYGWGAWNGENAVLALRNGDNGQKVLKTTLRKALELPDYVSGTIVLNKGLEQDDLKGLEAGKPIDVDAELTLTLPGSSVFVFDNTKERVIENYVVTDLQQVNNRTAYTVKSVNRGFIKYDQADPNYLRSSFVEGNRVDATPAGLPEEQFAFIHVDGVPEGHYYMYAMGAKKFVTAEGTKMALTTEPLDMVTLEPVSATDNKQFVIKFPGDKSINLTSNEDYYGTKLVQCTNDEGNMMTVTAVNHKAGLSTARAMVEDLYKYQKLVRDNWKAEVSSSSENHGVAQMLDNNVASYWQSAADGKMPYTLTFDLGGKQKFCSFGYYARLDSEAGACKSYAFDISNDKKEWKAVKSGELKFDGRKFVWGDFGKTVEAKYARLTISSNQAGDDVAAIAEFYLGYDGSAVTPEMNSLPLFSTEEAPQWYPVYFKKGGAYLQDMGADQKMKTANQKDVDAQQWQFMGNEYGFIMKSKIGNYVTFKDGRFFTTTDKTQASELEFMQSGGYYLELKVKGSSKCMNQFGGAGAGKELGEWNVGDGGNVLQVKPIEIPAAKLPTFSDDKNVAWYSIQFRNGNNVIEDKGEGNSVRLAVKSDAKTQLWKLVGDQKNFQLVSPEGLYMVVSDEPETEVGNQAGPNPHPVRTSTSAYEPGFKLTASENQNYGSAWEIQSNDAQFNGKSFNQHAGTNEGRTIGFWNAGDNNNPVEFVAVDVETAIEDVWVGVESVQEVYNLTGVRVGTDLKQLPKGVYIVNGKKVVK